MGLHSNTVFKNSCLKVPVNPLNRLPSASYERNVNKESEQKRSIESLHNGTSDGKNPLSFREFYKSIPDYSEINHLSNQEFYMKLENLRHDKHKLLLKCKSKIASSDDLHRFDKDLVLSKYLDLPTHIGDSKNILSGKYCNIADKYTEVNNFVDTTSDIESLMSIDNLSKDKHRPKSKTSFNTTRTNDHNISHKKERNTQDNRSSTKGNSPSFSISWGDGLNSPSKSELSDKLKYRDDSNPHSSSRVKYINSLSNKSYSVPTSPVKKSYSPQMALTVPQPFKMSERDEVNKIMREMKDYSKELESNFFQTNEKKKCFRANPVPIESRILLYDKIMEDQELRRSISKLQSTAELEAQMKPFKFTQREENLGNFGNMECRRLCRSNPQLALTSSLNDLNAFKAKKFKAKPVPKNLFSNYIYEKMKEDDYFRALNRRIRAEEMLRSASLPPSMAKRDKGPKDSPKSKRCHRLFGSEDSSEIDETRRNQDIKIRNKLIQNKLIRDAKLDKEYDNLKDEFDLPILMDENTKKLEHEEELKKIYGSNSSEPTTTSSVSANRPRSGFGGHSINRSNLAAILRIESSKKKLEADILKRLEEERYQSEIKWRDSVLRRKPAWKSIKYSHAEDLAMRLQMRRDEQRLREEQFLHDMELMYGRVHRQPLMFERCYSPRKGLPKHSFTNIYENIKLNDKPKSALSRRRWNKKVLSPNRSRKVYINERAETIGDDIEDYSYKDSYEDISKSSDDIPESIPEQLENDKKTDN